MLGVLRKVVVAVGRVHEVQAIIRAAAAEVEPAFGVHTVGLYLRDPSRGVLTVRPYEGLLPILMADFPDIRPDEAPLIEIEEVISAKVALAWLVGTVAHPAIRAALEAEGFRFLTIVPLLLKDQIVGLALMGRRTDVAFSPGELEVLAAIGSVVGVQVENATLVQELVSHRDQIRALTVGVRKAREAEATRMARHLHDIAGQLLASVRLTLEELAEALPPPAPERLRAVRSQLDQIEQQLRHRSHELRPPMLADLGFESALLFLGQGVLVQAILEVIRGGLYLNAGTSETVVQADLTKTSLPPDPLTPREREVLKLIAEGKTTKEIADFLGVSVKTVESHRTRLMEKLDIRQTAGLVRYAIRRGLIQP